MGLAVAVFCAAVAPADQPSAEDLKALDRDDAAAESAIDTGDLQKALRFVDFFGHEQEDFATATLQYGRSQLALRRAVVEAFGEKAWTETATALGVPRHDHDKGRRSVRREGDVVFVKNAGAEHEVPYVKVGGVWKLSVREVLLVALTARFGRDVKVEEADLHVLAGKMAKVVRKRSDDLSSLADSVRDGRVRSPGALRKAAEALRRTTGA